jgi:DNA polymerase-3 subunit alpha
LPQVPRRDDRAVCRYSRGAAQHNRDCPGAVQAIVETPRRLYRKAIIDERLEYELDIIEKMKFPGYFLIVADFIKWAKDHDIPVGPGRGSGAGSLVAYALTITDVDPLRFSLLFERFLNPARVSMPDFDIDFCQDRREEVIRYVQEKYGREQVAQIITFGRLQARAVLRDVGRVLEMPYGLVDRSASWCRTIRPIRHRSPRPSKKSRALRRGNGEGARRRRPARYRAEAGGALPPRLDPRRRHRHRRPAAVATGADVPRSALRHAGHPVQHEMGRAGRPREVRLPRPQDADRAEDRGRLHRQRGIKIDRRGLPLDDKPTYEMLARGETVGVFQVESAGMRKALIGMRPDRIEDIIALVALYRPGPMENIPVYNARKHGDEELASIHPKIDPGQGDAGRHRLPGTGDADRPGAGRLLARRSRPAAPRHGQEDQGGDGQAARHLRRGRGRARRLQAAGRHDLRPAGQVRQLRLQQVARRRLRASSPIRPPI